MGNTINKKCSAFLLVGSLLFQGCIAYGKKDKVSLASEAKTNTAQNVILSAVNVSNNIVTISGSGFSGVTALKIKGNGVDTTLNINSKSDTQISAVATSALAILVGATFDLILSSASAQTTYAITFTLDSMNAQSGQVLKFNGTSWRPESLASSQTYLGTWDAFTQTPVLEANPNSGDYYIVTVAGDYPNPGDTYNIGDWIIYNGTAWEKVVSGLSTKLSLTGGTLTGDLGLDTLLKFKGASNYVTLRASASLATDITLTLPITVGTNGQVLTTNGSGVLSWSTPAGSAAPSGAAGGDLSGTYPNPTITGLSAAKIADGSVNNTKFQYLSGVTSDIQTQLDAKQTGGNFITALTGDVTAAGPGSVAATVAQVGGVTAANIAAGVNIANAATNANTNSAAVKRDASGNFSAGTITANLVGTATNVTGTVVVANGGTGNTSLTLNELLFGNGTGAIGSVTSTGTPSVLLSTNVTGAPIWTTSTTGNFLKATTGVGVSFGAIGASDLPAGTLSGAGTVGYIPYYSTTTALDNSPLAVSGSSVGIGTATPSSTLQVNGVLTVAQGSSSAPAITFAGDSNTGIFSNGSDNLSFTTNGVHRISLTSAMAVYVPVRTSNSTTASSPAYSFGSDTDTGMFNSAANVLSFSTNALERVRIDPNGNVGIANDNPTEKLHVTGNILASGTVVGSSDRRLKKDIRIIEDALKKMDQITGVRYFWIEPELHNEGEQIGVIAQEVEKVFPQAVITGSDGLKAVSYMGLVAPVIQAIKELHVKFKTLIVKLTGLDTRVAHLEKENSELKMRLLKIEQSLVK